jgi:hypothetical protein
MTETVASVLVGAALVAVVAIVGRALWSMWRATMSDRQPVLMHRMLERQGVRIAGSEDYWTLEQAARASRRCVNCRELEACQAWLDRGETAGYEAFCPNASFIKALKEEQGAQPPARPAVRAS